MGQNTPGHAAAGEGAAGTPAPHQGSAGLLDPLSGHCRRVQASAAPLVALLCACLSPSLYAINIYFAIPERLHAAEL